MLLTFLLRLLCSVLGHHVYKRKTTFVTDFPIPVNFNSSNPKMSISSISRLAKSSSPWYVDLTFQGLKQYVSLQRRILEAVCFDRIPTEEIRLGNLELRIILNWLKPWSISRKHSLVVSACLPLSTNPVVHRPSLPGGMAVSSDCNCSDNRKTVAVRIKLDYFETN